LGIVAVADVVVVDALVSAAQERRADC